MKKFIQVSLQEMATVSNDGTKDGKCSMDGQLGKIVMDLVIDRWINLGNKYISIFIIFTPTFIL